ncbi:hypothetical protein L3Q82_025638 [Scortum barcoo]|uniref:Uncharacterized protein n=1 Tax=Scortum barcoo TaxID=214431 RepID=A0ACB8WKM5_9TELE|nr:hypothetical protein L3Q82_025638 [Scortum barcoo]
MFSASIVSGQFEVVDARSLVPVVVALPNPVVDTGSKGCSRMKKESYRTMLAYGTPDEVDRYRQAKASPAWTVLEAKTSGLGGVRTSEWQTGVVVPLLKRGTGECVQLQEDHTSQPPWEGLRHVWRGEFGR